MKRFWIGSGLVSALVVTAFTLASCGGGETKTEAPKSADSGAPAGGPAAMPDLDNGGTVTGKVTFDGTPPKMAVLDMSANPVCAKAHASAPLKSEEVVVNGNGTLKNVFVWVSAGLPDKTWQVPATAGDIDQNGCEYKPHVIALMAGQNLEIKNSDPTNHNIHPQPTVNQEFNESQAPGTPPITEDVRAAGNHDAGEVQRAQLDAVVYQRGLAPLLRGDGRRRNVYNKGSAAGDLHHRNRSREVRHSRSAGHGGGQGEQDRRFHGKGVGRNGEVSSQKSGVENGNRGRRG